MFELLDTDLAHMIRSKTKYDETHRQWLTYQVTHVWPRNPFLGLGRWAWKHARAQCKATCSVEHGHAAEGPLPGALGGAGVLALCLHAPTRREFLQ